MNNLFLRYDRYEKNKSSAITNSSQPPSSGANQPRTGGNPPFKTPVAAARSLPPPSQKPSETPLIDFSSGDSEHASVVRDMSNLGLHKDEDAAHIAEWIGDKEDKDEGITSSEFDKFLAERAAAGDTMPSGLEIRKIRMRGSPVRSLISFWRKGRLPETRRRDKEDKDEGITSSEFDKFLAERAAAGDT